MEAELGQELQCELESIYRIDRGPSVSDFYLESEELSELLGEGAARYDREALVVHRDGEDTDVGLYLSEAAREGAAAFRGGGDDIDSFCVVLEGVSHFLYFTYCGSVFDRPVSRIELELQAEVDKYLLLRLSRPQPDLVAVLFERIQLDGRLSAQERERYQLANRAARRYALSLERRIGQGEFGQVLVDVRHFYRKSFEAKLEHIAQAA